MNDGVDKDLCSLTYISVDNVAAIVCELGSGSLLAKVDRISIPPHPSPPR